MLQQQHKLMVETNLFSSMIKVSIENIFISIDFFIVLNNMKTSYGSLSDDILSVLSFSPLSFDFNDMCTHTHIRRYRFTFIE